MAEHDEDIDDVMSSILQRQRGVPPVLQPTKRPAKQKRQFKHDSTLSQPKPSVFAENNISIGQAHALPRRRGKLKRSFKVAILVIVLVLGLGTAGIILRGPIKSTVNNLLAPSSPFSVELAQKVDFPLFYPTKLPAGFKLDRDSIKQPEDNVIIYALTDNGGKSINITLQPQPTELNLDQLYSLLSNKREVDTSLGKMKIGNSEGKTIANLLTGKTWILINMPPETVNNANFDTLVKSFKQG